MPNRYAEAATKKGKAKNAKWGKTFIVLPADKCTLPNWTFAIPKGIMAGWACFGETDGPLDCGGGGEGSQLSDEMIGLIRAHTLSFKVGQDITTCA